MKLVARAAALTAIAALLRLTAPSPEHLLASHQTGLDGSLSPLLTLIGLLAWAGTAWLALVSGLLTAGRLPGQLGRCCRWAAARSAPAIVRRTLQVALGLTLVTGAAATLAGPASASTAPTPYGPVPTLDWPSAPQHDALAHHAAPAHAKHDLPRGRPTEPGQSGTITVSAGDSLWGLAREQLGADASPARIAQAWPRWWQANRDVIGDDPSVLSPGEQLRPPS